MAKSSKAHTECACKSHGKKSVLGCGGCGTELTDSNQQLDDIQTVVQLADDYLTAEQMRKFTGWDPDDVKDSEAALKRVKVRFNL